KMMFFILLPISIVYFSLMAFNIHMMKKWVTVEIEDRMVELAFGYAERFDGYLREVSQVAKSAASFIENRFDITAEQIFIQLGSNVQQNKLVYGSAMGFEPYQFEAGRRLFAPYVYREKDTLLRMDIGVEGYDYTQPQWEWWNKPKLQNKAVWTDPYFDEDAGNILMCTYSTPFYRKDTFWGVTTVDIPLKSLREFVDIQLKEGMEFAVVTKRTGTFVFSPDPQHIMKKSVFQIIKQYGQTDADDHVKAMSSGKMGIGKLNNEETKEVEWFCYAPIKSAEWSFIVKIPENEALAVVHKQIEGDIYIFIVAIVLIVVIIWAVSVLISKPILQLDAAAKKIAGGNLNVKAIVKSNDEIQTFADTFNKMTCNIHERLKEFMCFYHISQVSDKAEAKLEDIFQQAVRLIPQGWQYPEITSSKIQIEDRQYATDNFISTEWRQSADIFVYGEKKGFVEVCYLEERPNYDEGPFFKEERNLLNVIAEKFGKVIERVMLEKELEEAKVTAETASRTKSDFLSNMSHELRTPLNAVIGFSEVLRDEAFGPLNDKQKEYIIDVLDSGKHLLSLINDILDLSKVEAGKMELELSEFDLGVLLQNCLTLIKEKAMKHSITLSCEVPDDSISITADERKIKQVIFNILSNAAKFTPDGGEIGIQARRENKTRVLISIHDTGIGIEEKDRSKVFSEFEQIDSAYSRQYAGTGLGMPLTKKLVELHGGKIWFESQGEGKGTIFFFTLPLEAKIGG
ncbi:MAG: HAMP domain-containing protein, partial [Deltaproteobacteria bacterium]|nr:HAMP domain-containing protein [Deltaproteobacteria bacterium]